MGLSLDDSIWHPTSLTKNRERLLNQQLMGRFLEAWMAAPEVKPLLSNEHFSVDGTLLQAWASHASLERIQGEDDPPLHHQGRARNSERLRAKRSGPRSISAGSGSATRPTAQARIPIFCWPTSSTFIRPSPVLEATYSSTTAMAWWWMTV